MTFTYWAAQFIPSGWISVIFGLSTILTGILAYFWLNEPFGAERWTGLLLGIGGLATLFIQGTLTGSEQSVWGIGAILCAVVIYTVSSVLIKRVGADIPAFAITTGSLLVAVPCFILIWLLDGGSWPQVLSIRAAGSIIYLGVLGSVVGFVLYYFILNKMDASQAMSTTLIAPVIALFLGIVWNGEPLEGRIVFGTGMILIGLATFQWGSSLFVKAGAIK